MNHRRGTSLVEMLVVMTCASTVLSLSALLVHRTMHVRSRAEAFHREESNAWRLSACLREDASLATAFRIEQRDDNATLSFDEDAETFATYRFFGEKVLLERRDDSATVRKEEFEFPSVTGWKVDRLDSPSRVSVESRTEESTPLVPPLRLAVVARVGSPTAQEVGP